uniref:Uncharacterized protein n=1 Tax=Meloidogyne enterolobii TaxID=390850 RepID=A0A6V7WIG6_MELEN|nr:unnamed protein product [Meloidogyne enterolobii]
MYYFYSLKNKIYNFKIKISFIKFLNGKEICLKNSHNDFKNKATDIIDPGQRILKCLLYALFNAFMKCNT